MLDRIGKGILVLVLTLGVLLGAYIAYIRYYVERQDKLVEFCVDLNDVKKLAALEKAPLSPILDEIRKLGIASVGVYEETLPDANVLGEIHYAKGSGVKRIKLNPLFCQLSKKNLIVDDRTYIYAPFGDSRRRIYSELGWVLGTNALHFYKSNILEVNEREEELRTLGLGISEIQRSYLEAKGFRIIPRLLNDLRYNDKNISAKMSALAGSEIVIFDGEEILGYPEWIGSAADALKQYNIKYGYIEIVKQDGDALLRKLMGNDVVRVHSVPKDELKKISKDEAVTRFVRAARERKVKLFYLRPFLPPQAVGTPIIYNLAYFAEIKAEFEKAGFVVGKVEPNLDFKLAGWPLLVLGLGVVIGALFLANYFMEISVGWLYMWLVFFGALIYIPIHFGNTIILQKLLAFAAAVTFPSSAVIATFSKPSRNALSLRGSILAVLNIVAETLIGVFLLIGIMADSRFMLGVETFPGVKIALVLPVFIVALYFILKQGEGTLSERVRSLMNMEVKLAAVAGGLAALGALGIFVARSGNFILPVPGFEKYFRNFLEMALFIRPRTKEFLVGYPFLFLAAAMWMGGDRRWLWVLTAIGVIAPISIINSFSHAHTPLLVSMARTLNGLALGIIIGIIIIQIAKRYMKK